ncbi:(2R)-sulfolactate sulfo-lyase subunit alpha [Haloactinopolyspora alba]|uniref:(2R)-sulfolactate sulfo-lyase subunit alpha n=1 Tax=Haloactinopolyspora alba TaxID=648780 RepID=A0A2P8EG02_9ACTN|nr:UxaA family hydrolase [Haloactinopolyspora alba]PSL08397.1 (2R)-sulfolactate sulfo-lyase subunit alpha [Haloactinopolyspora alba]
MPQQPPDFLAHLDGDSVAVAVRTVPAGPAEGAYLDSPGTIDVTVATEVPLGHKIALTDVPAGQDVIEYGVRVGVASADITKGDYVHVHNLRSARWQSSVA